MIRQTSFPAILFVHNRYQYEGGEDTVLAAESRLLRQRGHRVAFFTVDNTRIPEERSLVVAGKLAISTTWSRSARRQLERAILSFAPDIVHVHNTFPLISPAIYSVCQNYDVPVVQTLHNYRLLCLNAYLFRDGHPCQECVGRLIPFPGVRYACYRHSRQQSLAVAAMLTSHRLRGTWHTEVDRFIALSEFARQRFIDGGLPAEKITVKSNFLAEDPGTGDGTGGYVAFVGRLDQTKGVQTLLDAWQLYGAPFPLRIVGDGPLAQEVAGVADRHPLITYLGRVNHRQVLSTLQGATAMAFPSPLYENFPMSILESFACGTPVIASDTGSTAEIVTNEVNGLKFQPENANELAARVGYLANQPELAGRLRREARITFEQQYTAAINYDLLSDIYREVIEQRQLDLHSA